MSFGDATVRGGFELSSEAALRSLSDIRDRGREADQALESLGRRMDELGLKRVTPTIDLRGLDEANRRLTEFEARLDRIGAKSVSARVGVSGGGVPGMPGIPGGGGGGGGAGGGSPLLSSLGGMGGRLPWWAPALPLAPDLVGGAGALVSSAGSAALGAGVVGLGGIAPLAAGAGFTMAIAGPAIQALGTITKAQTAYNKAVEEFGRTSAQAATAQHNLNYALAQNPAAAGAAIQWQATRNAWQTATAPARANVYGGVSQVLYNARQAMPTLGMAATGATGAVARSAGALSGFLAAPQQQAAVLQLTGAFAGELPIAERSLQNIATVFEHLAVDALPFFHEANMWVMQWTAGLARSSADQPRVQAGMQGMVNSAKDWARLIGAAGRDLRDLFSPGRTSGDSMVVRLTDTLNRWDVWLRDNPGRVQSFFANATTGTERIATVIGNLARDLAQIYGFLQPILGRAEQFMSFASSIGGGSLLAGGTALWALYNGGRAALGGRGPSAGGLLSSFVTGGAAPAFRSTMGAGAPAGGFSPVSAAAGAAGARYLAPRGYTIGAAGEAVPGIATPEAFSAAYGGVAGARYAAPMLAAEREAGALSKAGTAITGALRSFAPVMAVLSAVSGVAAGLQGPGGVPTSINRGLSTAASTLTLGMVQPSAFQHIFSSAFGATNAGASIDPTGFVRSVDAQATAVRSPQELRALQTRVAGVRLQYEMTPGDARRLQTQLDTAVRTAAANAGAYASNQWENAFVTAINRGQRPADAVRKMLTAMTSQLRSLGPSGARAFAQDTATWVAQMERDNPKLIKPLDSLMNGITNRINQMNHSTGTSFKDLQDKVFYFNGQILSGATTTWNKIHDALVDPSARALEQMTGIWGQMQTQAINALQGMGYSRAQARNIVTMSAQGGTNAATANAAVRATTSGFSVSGNGVSSSGPWTPLSRARGGQIPGGGLLDTVGMGGAVVAPGEAWIANRHTMNDLSLATLEKYGKTAWQVIGEETRLHSAPLSSPSPQRRAFGGGLFSAIGSAVAGVRNFASGTGGSGWVHRQHPELHAGIAAAVEQVLDRYPLTITSTTRGGHASGSYHYLGEAADISGPGSTMMAAAQWIISSGLARQLAEGIHNPNLSVKNGRAVSPGFWGAGTWAQHLNHIHMAIAGALGAIGGGGGGMVSSISLNPRMVSNHGIPGAIADQGIRLEASTLQNKVNSALASMPGAGGNMISAAGFHGGGSNSANAQLGHQMMLAAGWPESQWPALFALWTRESGWNANAVNASSGAAGIPQALGHGHVFNLGDAPAQIAWGLNYIRSAYGSPAGAWGHEQSHGWYGRGGRTNWAGWNARGGTFVTDGPTLFGAGEAGQPERVSITPVGRGDSTRINITMQHVTFNGGNAQELEATAQHVAGLIIAALDRTSGGASDGALIGASA